MSNNRASRKGIGVERSDYDVVSSALRSAGVDFGERLSTYSNDRTRPNELGRRKCSVIGFETTSLFFDGMGRYLGREYAARDECDYFKPREAQRKAGGQ